MYIYINRHSHAYIYIYIYIYIYVYVLEIYLKYNTCMGFIHAINVSCPYYVTRAFSLGKHTYTHAHIHMTESDTGTR
jgi:hypothetical protein